MLVPSSQPISVGPEGGKRRGSMGEERRGKGIKENRKGEGKTRGRRQEDERNYAINREKEDLKEKNLYRLEMT
jgi:hypothetical protein